MYGKTIIKPVETDAVVKDNKDEFGQYVYYNYSYIDSVIEVNGICYIKQVKPILSHYNYDHCGVEILSMSERIMNKVLSCVPMIVVLKTYYQDTGSIHLNYGDVDKVVKNYKEYGFELVGENLGNFHVDLPDLQTGCGEVYAIESLCLGKTSYFDHLESTCKEGKLINGDLSRMKGIPTSCIVF